MNALVDLINKSKDALALTGACDEDIVAAENTLSLIFSNEYKEYTSTFGAVSINGMELTGVVPNHDLNIVDVTISARSITPQASHDWYVIRDLHIDGVIIWQNERGEVFQTQPYREPKKLCNSIYEYLNL